MKNKKVEGSLPDTTHPYILFREQEESESKKIGETDIQ